MKSGLEWTYNKDKERWDLFEFNGGYRLSISDDKLTELKIEYRLIDDMMVLEEFSYRGKL